MVLRALIDESDDPGLRESSRALVHRRMAPPFRVSHLVVGEAFAGIAKARRGRDIDPMWHFEQLLHRSRRIEIVGVPRDHGIAYHRCVLRLHGSEAWLEPNDASILGVACIDPDCSTFYTTDIVMLESDGLLGVAREYGTDIMEL
ncbi:MAG: hypothetical protein GWN97_00435 [Thermoplasmata archaeon]|nr:hypothetical protein [Thermoplasmata archaeon]NIS10429.1 hypothetical protein [Thermoplasmata archaeon]